MKYPNELTDLGESPPPLPMTEPPINNLGRRYNILEGSSGHSYDGYNPSQPRSEWSNSQSRPSSVTMQDTPKMSHRIRDLFVRKKRHNSQM